MKERVTRTGISFDSDLLKMLDQWIKEKGFPNRSEALRYITRNYLIDTHISEEPESETVGSLTYFYDHHKFDCSNKLTNVQHNHSKIIISTMHVHLSHNICIETIFVKGKARELEQFSEEVIALKGVLGGKLYLIPDIDYLPQK